MTLMSGTSVFINEKYYNMKFTCDIFPITIWVEIEDDWDWNDAHTLFWDWCGSTITLYRNSKTDLEDAILHEVIHAVSHWLRHIGIDHIEETEEAYTYTIGYFYKVILKRVKKDLLGKQISI